jgi:hypothetical protein
MTIGFFFCAKKTIKPLPARLKPFSNIPLPDMKMIRKVNIKYHKSRENG